MTGPSTRERLVRGAVGLLLVGVVAWGLSGGLGSLPFAPVVFAVAGFFGVSFLVQGATASPG